MIKVLTLTIALIMLQACSKAPRIEIREQPVPVICDLSARPDALDLTDTPPTLVQDPAGVWGFWFSPDLYAGMAENLQAMRRWMKQSNDVRAKLIECIEDHNAAAQTE